MMEHINMAKELVDKKLSILTDEELKAFEDELAELLN